MALKPILKGLICGIGKGLKLVTNNYPIVIKEGSDFTIETDLTSTYIDPGVGGQFFLGLSNTGSYVRIVQGKFHTRIGSSGTAVSITVDNVTAVVGVRYKVIVSVINRIATISVWGSDGSYGTKTATMEAAGTLFNCTPSYFGLWQVADKREFTGVIHNVKITSTGVADVVFPFDKLQMPDYIETNYGSYLNPKPANKYPKKNMITGFSSLKLGTLTMPSYSDWKATLNNPTGLPANAYWLVDVKPNTDYTFSVEKPAGVEIAAFDVNASTVLNAGGYLTTNSVSFNSGPRTQARIYVRQSAPNTTFEVGKPMLNEGSLQPFEPYQLIHKPSTLYNSKNKVAVLYPQKNLFTLDNAITTNAAGTTFQTLSKNDVVVTSGSNTFSACKTAMFPVKPNTQYTLSFTVEHISGADNPRVSPRKGTDGSGIGIVDGTGYKTLTFNSGTETQIYLLLYGNLGTATVQTNKYSNVQLEEGTTATPFEPYKIGNKPAK
ncbi:hypothetical protein AB3N02_13825 [Priestia aryabhattai]|uniref:hypothetical protein n=1 Tax=Priestia aryabhattai TaxID=412384 RepID=UPI00399F5283